MLRQGSEKKRTHILALRHTILLSCTLTACSSEPRSLEPIYVPPSPPTEKAILAIIQGVAAEAKLGAPLQISDVRLADRGPGRYFICLRGTNAQPDERQRYYAVFFDNDIYKGSRLSVITEQCEIQTFNPVPAATPMLPASSPTPAVKRKAAQ
jgi:hypothetical protein